MLLSRLTPVTLHKITSNRGLDGDIVETYETVLSVDGTIQYLASDEVSASAYGANLDKTYRFKSVYNDLEQFLLEKTNNSPNNLTKYLVEWKRSQVLYCESYTCVYRHTVEVISYDKR